MNGPQIKTQDNTHGGCGNISFRSYLINILSLQHIQICFRNNHLTETYGQIRADDLFGNEMDTRHA